MGLILVVSEDAVEVETIRGALSVHGWWVTLTPDRETALQVAADQAPKLVIVDNEVPGALDLIRNFGTAGGGPGALVSTADGAEGALELTEAGADEVLTKPVTPHGVLEAVQRCLAARPQAPVSRAAHPSQLLTTEEIFGEVLRELEEEVAPVEVEAVERNVETTKAREQPERLRAAPPSVPAAPAEVSKPDSARPVVSLAGLFDGDEDSEGASLIVPGSLLAGALDPDGVVAPALPGPRAEVDALWAPETDAARSQTAPKGAIDSAGSAAAVDPPESPAGSILADWDGSNRRGSERPWTGPEEGSESLFQAVDDELDSALSVETEPGSRATETSPGQAGTHSAGSLEDLDLALREEATPESPLADESTPRQVGKLEDLDLRIPEVSVVDEGARRLPVLAIWLGGLAAALLIAAGVFFFLNPGAEVDEGSVGAGEPVPAVELPVPPTADPGAEAASGSESLDAGAPPPAAAPVARKDEASAAPAKDRVGDLDLQAIVDQELDRREQELRRIFVEEEKRLLRELRKLDEQEPPADDEEQESDNGGVGA